jgi:eukaryotic-like serine/threonine-protein kinase
MPLPSGTKLGPYEIVSPLGAGGMGEVYRAIDKRLDRSVAIKILPAHLSSSPEAKERFEREAKSISALQHGNICTLYDVGEQNGVNFLVMEYLEGETLADRLCKGPLPLEQVYRHGAEICDGLERAHKRGIVHRDLKPGNIMLTKSGAKLMDFGLAKPSVPVAQSSSELTQTLAAPTHPLTAQGSIVGTFQYMSPEQVEGKEIDARSDIFSLGGVLYEMATAKRAFEGKSTISVAAAILEKEPDNIAKVLPLSPAAFQHVIEGCLAKDPESRWQSAGDVGRQLRWIGSGGSQAAAPIPHVRSGRTRERVLWGLLAALLLGLSLWMYQSRPVARSFRASLLPPADASFDFMGDFSGPPVLSPDGSRVAFAAHAAKERNTLWVRVLNGTTQKLAGTEGAYCQFWSYDGRFIGFFADGKLKKIPASGGPVTSLADAPNARGGAWGKDDVILYTPDYRGSIWKVSGAGSGVPAQATKLDPSKHSTHRWPAFLPDGKHFLFLATNHSGGSTQQNGAYLGSVGEDGTKLVLSTDSQVQYAAGYLLFHQQQSVMAQKFDLNAGTLSGEQMVVVDDVMYDSGTWHTTFTASDDGLLLYGPGTSSIADYRLAWTDREGKLLGTVGEPASYRGMKLSPDGKRLVLAAGDPLIDIWVFDFERGVKTRLTFDSATHIEPAWSADGQKIVYMVQNGSIITAGSTLHSKPANGSGQDELLLSPEDSTTTTTLSWPEWSADGRYLAFQKQSGPTGASVWAMPVAGDRKPFLVVKPESAQGSVTFSRLSPDGRWLAYSARDSDREEVYVTTFPSGSGRWQVSSEGGIFPVWRGDGKELFYIGYDAQLHAVETSPGKEEFGIGRTQSLFPVRYVTPFFNPYDVSPDGKRMLIAFPLSSQSSPLVLVSDWKAELKK